MKEVKAIFLVLNRLILFETYNSSSIPANALNPWGFEMEFIRPAINLQYLSSDHATNMSTFILI